MTPGVSLVQAIVSAVVGTLWLGLAGLIVAQATGMTDISPMSGMALISDANDVYVTLLAQWSWASLFVAIGQGADMMQDLKTGFMLGGPCQTATCTIWCHLDWCYFSNGRNHIL